MAKVGFWLRGARGKMGGAVLMKSENGTVARENVTPKNPRTDKQMYQRAIFATVATAAKAMKELINHSFYGIADGTKCIQQFRKLNLAKLRNKVAADIAADLTPSDRIAMLAPKNYKFIVPNEYQISSGTLASPSIHLKQTANGGLAIENTTVRVTADNWSYGEILHDILGINPGEQLTLAFISINMDVAVGDYSTDPNDSVGYIVKENSFGAVRFVAKEDGIVDYTEALAKNTLTKDSIIAVLQDVCDTMKSDPQFIAWIKEALSVSTDGTTKVIDIEGSDLTGSNGNSNLKVKAAAFIRSKFENGQWNYSTAMMKINDPDEDWNYGVVPEAAVASYTEGTSLGTSHDPFLDEGGNGGSI